MWLVVNAFYFKAMFLEKMNLIFISKKDLLKRHHPKEGILKFLAVLSILV